MKQTQVDIKGQTNINTIIEGDLYTPLSQMINYTKKQSKTKQKTNIRAEQNLHTDRFNGHL